MHRLCGLRAGLPGDSHLVEDQVPAEWESYIALNRDYFDDKDLDELKQATQDAPRNVGEAQT